MENEKKTEHPLKLNWEMQGRGVQMMTGVWRDELMGEEEMLIEGVREHASTFLVLRSWISAFAELFSKARIV